MKTSFPDGLPALTIELGPLLHDPSLRLSAVPSSAASVHSAQSIPPPLSPQSPRSLKSTPTTPLTGEPSTAHLGPPAVQSIHLAPESLECVVVVNNGTVILSRLDADGATATSPSELDDEELVSLTHVPVPSKMRYRPYLGVRTAWGTVSACAMSDVGESSTRSDTRTCSHHRLVRLPRRGVQLLRAAHCRHERPARDPA